MTLISKMNYIEGKDRRKADDICESFSPVYFKGFLSNGRVGPIWEELN
jgi:hypothetical protein